jgi:hypothetical protein
MNDRAISGAVVAALLALRRGNGLWHGHGRARRRRGPPRAPSLGADGLGGRDGGRAAARADIEDVVAWPEGHARDGAVADTRPKSEGRIVEVAGGGRVGEDAITIC